MLRGWKEKERGDGELAFPSFSVDYSLPSSRSLDRVIATGKTLTHLHPFVPLAPPVPSRPASLSPKLARSFALPLVRIRQPTASSPFPCSHAVHLPQPQVDLQMDSEDSQVQFGSYQNTTCALPHRHFSSLEEITSSFPPPKHSPPSLQQSLPQPTLRQLTSSLHTSSRSPILDVTARTRVVQGGKGTRLVESSRAESFLLTFSSSLSLSQRPN